jgi:preprotein translocase subunit SecE
VAKQAAQKQIRENAVIRYFRETWFELKKVSWPTRSEARNLTLIVILATTFLAIILSLIDWVISLGFGLFL